MDNILQDILDKSGAYGETYIPCGEFEGCFHIKKPCTIIGNSTVLWSCKGPIVIIESKKVKLKNIRIEIMPSLKSNANNDCIYSMYDDTEFENIEIIGNIKGISNEDGNWDIPKIIELGNFKAGEINTYQLEVYVSNETYIKCNIDGIKIKENILKKGYNNITIETEKLKENIFIYGEILFKSKFIRRSYLSGKSILNTDILVNKKIYSSNKSDLSESKSNFILNNVTIVQRGMRIAVKSILENNIVIKFSYEKLLCQMDIDPYVFLLDENEKANYDNNLIFFGNTYSQCGGIYVNLSQNNLDKNIEIKFDKISADIKKIAVVYSIYGDDLNYNFSKVINPVISIFSSQKEKMKFQIDNLSLETTIVGVEFYRYKNEWKLNAVGAGYKSGIKSLCESYGRATCC